MWKIFSVENKKNYKNIEQINPESPDLGCIYGKSKIETLEPFGGIQNIKFDAGPETLDREIGLRLVSKPRVMQIYSRRSPSTSVLF